MRPLPTFRQLLAVIILGCVLPITGLALALVAYEYQRERDQVEQTAVGTARALMTDVDDRFEGMQNSLQGLASSPALAVGDLGKLFEEAQVFSRTQRVQGVLLVDANGTELVNTRTPSGQPLSTQPRALLPPAPQRATVLDLFRSPITGQYATGILLPLPQGRTLQVDLDPRWLREVLLRQKLPPSWVAAVLDRSGHIVARTREHERYLGTTARTELLERIAERPEDAVRSVTVDGVPVVSAFSRSDRSGWSVVIGMPREELRAPLLRSTAVLLSGTAAVLLLTLWMAWRLARRLGASMEALGGAVRAAVHHAPLDLSRPAFQEAHQLGQALLHANTVAEDAASAHRRIEQRMRSVLDTSIDGIVVADHNGRIVLFNRAAEAMFRLPEEEAIGMEVEQLLAPGERARHRELREHIGLEEARKMAPNRVVEGLRTDGRSFRAEASISVTQGEDGRLYTAVLRPLPDA
ncbi:PAS domain S-box protein [Ramlibacter ginsenosidimutans]|uniref:PAS domain S-box protein n=1 Tax=Ramlibacter ginsenosidimutans TaxID=502333 RepID=A0A934TW48_9BURK|nr:cache domain-containing protein [Ramlibacter ginsenosidimutans]MBK6008544.1 PAS domain S-box protein [Ramlibacter ginsenosidimutans]